MHFMPVLFNIHSCWLSAWKPSWNHENSISTRCFSRFRDVDHPGFGIHQGPQPTQHTPIGVWFFRFLPLKQIKKDEHPGQIGGWTNPFLVGNWTKPSEKYACQIGNLSQLGVKIKRCLKPPPRFSLKRQKPHRFHATHFHVHSTPFSK